MAMVVHNLVVRVLVAQAGDLGLIPKLIIFP